jgi:sedoheptulokinase
MLSTGCRLSAGYLGTTLFAMRRLQQLSSAVDHVSFVADWIGSQLTGQNPVTERSHAASSGLYDLQSDEWSDALLQAAEIPRCWLPDVRESGAVTGQLNDVMSAATGLPAGLPVFNAIGDNQASVLSALPDQPGSILINIGTGGQIVWRVPAFVRQLPLDTRILPGTPDSVSLQPQSQFMIVGAGLCGGDAIAWVNRTVRHWLQMFGLNVTEDEVWDRLQASVSPQQSSSALVCEPFFRGTRYEPERRGVLKGISPDNLTPPNMLISVLDGIAQSMFDVWASSPEARQHPLQRVAMSGNAVKRNPLLVEAVRRRFGVPVEVARHSEEAATGTAMLAGVHLGLWNSIEDARRLVQQAAQ